MRSGLVGRIFSAAVVLLLATPALAALQAGDRVDLRVLVLWADGTEPALGAWTAALSREGVPHDVMVGNPASPTRRCRPHDFHEANLAEDGIFYAVVGEVLARYNSYLTVPLYQPTQTESAEILAQQKAWDAAWQLPEGQAPVAYVKDGVVVISGIDATPVPITGTYDGSWYGGDKWGWENGCGKGKAAKAKRSARKWLSKKSKKDDDKDRWGWCKDKKKDGRSYRSR